MTKEEIVESIVTAIMNSTSQSKPEEPIICDMCGHPNKPGLSICKMCSNYLTRREK